MTTAAIKRSADDEEYQEGKTKRLCSCGKKLTQPEYKAHLKDGTHKAKADRLAKD